MLVSKIAAFFAAVAVASAGIALAAPAAAHHAGADSATSVVSVSSQGDTGWQ